MSIPFINFAVSSNKRLITFCFGVEFFMLLLLPIGKLYIFLSKTNKRGNYSTICSLSLIFPVTVLLIGSNYAQVFGYALT